MNVADHLPPMEHYICLHCRVELCLCLGTLPMLDLQTPLLLCFTAQIEASFDETSVSP